MELAIKASLGAIAVILIQVLSQSKNYYLAGLVPLFPTFALIAHYIIGIEKTTHELKHTILFGIFSLIPYLFYLCSLYWLVSKVRLVQSLTYATIVWLLASIALIFIWNKLNV